ncbi:beta-lactamase family protein [Spiractinospora alimapuensis]|uniref:serine hydrolase domain-containing protein n=1 Tax=Spiractinospora alimapuensis TaxID=2820884 RepID=UPI001F1FB803|nr:serine hydrolase domain-containing protein [Spiractinospora alimapuensis]QVQ50223.1 beta-lactamase family protein [Spiractinospora alimapuensis]
MPKSRAGLSALCAVALAVPVVLTPGAAIGAVAGGTSPPVAAPLSPETAQEFLDSRVAELLEEHQAPGVGVAIVGDGELVGAVGHGYADIDRELPVDPATTSFHTGSAAKTYTAVAVLQLVEEGLVDLDEDVNTYLPDDARVEDTYPGDPVTLHHLLTHTAGFEERMDGMILTDPDQVSPLGAHFASSEVERIRPPGGLVAYSNHGFGLAGLVVEEVTGVPFDEYAEDNIFTPLGMDQSGFGQMDQARERFDVPTFHDADGEPLPDYYMEEIPAGSAVATVEDMARFLLALLDADKGDGQRVLTPESVELLLSHQGGPASQVNGAGYGIWEYQSSPDAFTHGGDWIGAYTRYVFVPELDLGVYVAVNGSDGTAASRDLRTAVIDEFMREFASADLPMGEADPAADLQPYTGVFVTTRKSHSDLNRIQEIVGNLRVSDNGDGTLDIAGPDAVDDRWLPVRDGVFVAQNGGDMIEFVSRDGEVVGFSAHGNPTHAYEAVGTANDPLVHLLAAGAGLLVLLTGLVSLGRPWDRPTTAARVIAGLTALSAVVSVGLIVYGLSDFNRLTQWIAEGSLALTVPMWVTAGLAVVMGVLTGTGWVRGWWRVRRLVHYSSLTVAALVVVAFGWSYGFM